MPGWDEAYAASAPAPWDIGLPQPAFVRLAEQGLLSGQVLDSGCGTGEQTLLAAAHGADAMGVDVSGRAVQRARDKAAERGLRARFEVADALHLDDLGLTFDTIIDSGVFHVFDDAKRARYVASLASVLRPGGNCYLICFSDRQPGTAGPAGCARTSCAPPSVTGGRSPASRRRPSNSTGPGSASRPRRPGWPSSSGPAMIIGNAGHATSGKHWMAKVRR